MAARENMINRRFWQVLFIMVLLILFFIFGDKIIATITGLGLLMWEKLKERWNPVSSREEHNRVIQELEDRITAIKTAGTEIRSDIEKIENKIRSLTGDLSEIEKEKLSLLDSIAERHAAIDNMTLEELVRYANTHH
jgi:uncharacterized coiled-coil DUF342 family protein